MEILQQDHTHSIVALSKPDKQNKISSNPLPNNLKLEVQVLFRVLEMGKGISNIQALEAYGKKKWQYS